MLANTHLRTRVRGVCVRVVDAVYIRTSLPRELSAIADLNPTDTLSAGRGSPSGAGVTKQVHTLLFFRNKALTIRTSSAGFLPKRDRSREPTSTQSYLRIILQKGGRGLHVVIAAVSDYF